jgi:hypothetical protein
MLFDLTFPCYLTTFSGKKCLSGKIICAFFCPAYQRSPVYAMSCLPRNQSAKLPSSHAESVVTDALIKECTQRVAYSGIYSTFPPTWLHRSRQGERGCLILTQVAHFSHLTARYIETGVLTEKT